MSIEITKKTVIGEFSLTDVCRMVGKQYHDTRKIILNSIGFCKSKYTSEDLSKIREIWEKSKIDKNQLELNVKLREKVKRMNEHESILIEVNKKRCRKCREWRRLKGKEYGRCYKTDSIMFCHEDKECDL